MAAHGEKILESHALGGNSRIVRERRWDSGANPTTGPWSSEVWARGRPPSARPAKGLSQNSQCLTCRTRPLLAGHSGRLRDPFDVDAIDLSYFGSLRRRHLNHALVELGLDLGVINGIRRSQRALKSTVSAFGKTVVVVFLLLSRLLLTLDGEDAIRQGDGQVGLIDTW